MHLFKSIYSGDISLEDVEKEPTELKKDLGRIKQGNPSIIKINHLNKKDFK